MDPNQDLFVAGFLEMNATHGRLIANSKGLTAYHANTDVSLSTTVRTPDGTGSGWASGGAREWGRIDAIALGRRAAQKAVASRNPVAIEPGRYGDLVAVSGDPLQNIRLLEHVDAVIKGGDLVKAPGAAPAQ